MSLLRTLMMRCNSRFCFITPNILTSKRNYAKIKWITMYLEDAKGHKYTLKGEVGFPIRDAVQDTLIMPDYGVCGGMPSCTTCHVIFCVEDYNRIFPPDSLESDLLEQTIEVTPTSRLGCQVIVEECMDGMELKLPKVTQDNRCI